MVSKTTTVHVEISTWKKIKKVSKKEGVTMPKAVKMIVKASGF